MALGDENSISSMMKDITVESELSLIKIIAKKDINQTEIGGYKINDQEEGSKFEVPKWVASILSDMDLIEFVDDGIEIEVFKALNQEKLLGNQLSELRPDLYKKINFLLKNWKNKLSNDPELIQNYEKLSTSLLDLINIRISKIIGLASLSYPPDDLHKHLTSEEFLLFDNVQKQIQEWRNSMIGEEHV